MFKTVQIGKVHEEVSRQIARKIIAGDIQPGESLPTESSLTSAFEVSRVVVREALRSLAQRGLIEQSQGRRTVVLPESAWDIFDLMILTIMREEGKIYPVLRDFTWIRLNVEPQIAEDAANLNDQALLKDLQGYVDEMERLQRKHEGYYKADLDFHARLAAATGNRVLYRLMNIFGTLFSEARGLSDGLFAESARGVADHKLLLAAISSGDAPGARRLMQRHIEWAQEGVAEWYASGRKLEP